MKLLEKHFEIALETPDGITKLRELIFNLGIKSKLVPNNSIDVPAIKTLNKGYSVINNDEYLFDIPKNWSWNFLGSIINVKSSKRIFENDYTFDGVPFYRSKEIGELSRNGFCEDRLFISKDKFKEIKDKFGVAKQGDILLTSVGSIGGCWIVDDRDFYYKDGNVTLLEVNNQISSEYLRLFIKSSLFIEQVKNAVSGTAYNALTIIKIKSLKIPVPPLEEQKRIVEKIDQLMLLCDKLEEERNRKHKLQLQMNSAAINNLIKANDEKTFNNAWSFIANQFDTLYTVKQNVTDLREVILNLAMRGKLVLQDDKEQSAIELHKEILVEKNNLIKRGSIRKQKELTAIKKDEITYEVPKNWKWVRLNDFGTWKSGSTPNRSNSSFYDGNIPWVKSGEVKQGRIKFTSETITDYALEKCSLHINPIGSVLIAMYGANIGEAGVLEIEAATNQAVCACNAYEGIDNNYLYNLLLSLKNNFISQGAGAAQPNISREKIINTVVPLPPYDEQKRIVKRINQLFELCDKLEKNIEQSSKKKSQILNAVLAQV